MAGERFFHVSYATREKNGETGFGSVWVNLIEGKVTREVLKDWKEFIEQKINTEGIIILFYKEFEENLND